LFVTLKAQEKKLPHREEKVVSLKKCLAQKGTAPETAEYNIFKTDVELIEEEIKEMQLKEGKKKVEDLKSKFQEKDRDHIDTGNYKLYHCVLLSITMLVNFSLSPNVVLNTALCFRTPSIFAVPSVLEMKCASREDKGLSETGKCFFCV
jgi:hypothetical protein